MLASRVNCLTPTHHEFTGGTWQMIMDFFALGTTLTGRLVVAQRVNSLPVTGMLFKQQQPTRLSFLPDACICAVGAIVEATAVRPWKAAFRAA